jgi:hypothetical protein
MTPRNRVKIPTIRRIGRTTPSIARSRKRVNRSAKSSPLVSVFSIRSDLSLPCDSREGVLILKKGTDYSVPRRKCLILGLLFGVDRAVCPLFQQAPRSRQSHARSDGRIGSWRTRLRVIANRALVTAGAIPGVPASPMPPGAAVLGTMWTSITGISSMRSTSY